METREIKAITAALRLVGWINLIGSVVMILGIVAGASKWLIPIIIWSLLLSLFCLKAKVVVKHGK